MEVFSVSLFLGMTIVVVALSSFWWSRRRLRELASLLPGPKPPRFNLFIGDTERFITSSNDTFKVLSRMIDEFGPTCRMWIGPKLCVLLTDPNDVEVILTNTRLLNRDQFLMKVVRPLAGDGLISSTADIWRAHRKVMLPTFHSKILEKFVDVFYRNAVILAQNLAEHTNGPSFDVLHAIGMCAIDMISETSMGETVNAQIKKDNEFVTSFKHGVDIIQRRVAKPWLLVDWVFNLTSLGRKQTKVVKTANATIYRVISNRLTNFREMGEESNSNDRNRTGEKKCTNSLDLLIDSESNIVNSEFLKDEINTLLIAGQESTATVMSFALLLLGLHQDVQDKVIKEQEDIFKSEFDRELHHQDLHQMRYLGQVLKETLRLFPPAPMLTREIEEEMDVNGRTLPAGCTAIIINYKTHRHPDWFTNPEDFDPDQFLPERSFGRHPYACVPFGMGQRSCIGQKYSMLQMKTVLSVILRQYKVLTRCSMKDLQTLEMGLVLRPSCGFPIQLLPRKS